MSRRKDIFKRIVDILEWEQQPEKREQRFRRMAESLPTAEQRKQREAAREEIRLRRELAKVGLTQEQFDENVREFVRKFSR